jgi:hypothetical protein
MGGPGVAGRGCSTTLASAELIAQQWTKHPKLSIALSQDLQMQLRGVKRAVRENYHSPSPTEEAQVIKTLEGIWGRGGKALSIPDLGIR